MIFKLVIRCGNKLIKSSFVFNQGVVDFSNIGIKSVASPSNSINRNQLVCSSVIPYHSAEVVVASINDNSFCTKEKVRLNIEICKAIPCSFVRNLMPYYRHCVYASCKSKIVKIISIYKCCRCSVSIALNLNTFTKKEYINIAMLGELDILVSR